MDLLDLCKRIDLRTANKRVMENLTRAGAFDVLPGNRAQQFEEISTIIDHAVAWKKDKASGQIGLFASEAEKAGKPELYSFTPLAEWPEREKLEKEKEVVGFYLSAHPLSTYEKQLKRFSIETFNTIFERIQNYTGEQEFMAIGCGLLKSRKDIVTKKGDRMCFIQLEDLSGSCEIVVFPRTFAKIEQWLNDYHVFLIKGNVDLTATKQCKLKAQELVPIELALKEWGRIAKVSFTLPPTVDEELLQKLQEHMVKGSIPTECIFHENGKKLRLSSRKRIALDSNTVDKIEQLNIGVSVNL